MVALGPINSWQPPSGPVTTWLASPVARDHARRAGRDPLPPSFQQSVHLRAAFRGKALGSQLPRLMVVAWDIPGECDTAAMTAAINAHIRRHDTYHSAFHFEDGEIVRRTIDDPGKVELVPVSCGEMTPEQIRTHALRTTPDTLDWDCFSFGVIAGADHFTFYASVDHLHIDGISAALIFLDIHLTYQDLVQGRPSTLASVAGYYDYVVRQQERLAALTLESPEIKDWTRFARDADGDWPSFPLSLGDTSASPFGELETVRVLNAAETEAFSTAYRAAGARFIGGVLAAAAIAEHRLTGTDTYRGFTAVDTRAATDILSVGWYGSLCPITVPIGGGGFAEAARAAQSSFDNDKHLAYVPFDRVLELNSQGQGGIEPSMRPAMMLSYVDFRNNPCAAMFEETNWGIYGDEFSHGGINMWINRFADGIYLSISYPDNPVARRSVHRYIAELSQVVAEIAGHRPLDPAARPLVCEQTVRQLRRELVLQ